MDQYLPLQYVDLKISLGQVVNHPDLTSQSTHKNNRRTQVYLQRIQQMRKVS
jgi:hypothetical protein